MEITVDMSCIPSISGKNWAQTSLYGLGKLSLSKFDILSISVFCPVMNKKQHNPGSTYNTVGQAKNKVQGPGSTLTRSAHPRRLPSLGLSSICLSTFSCGRPDSSKQRHQLIQEQSMVMNRFTWLQLPRVNFAEQLVQLVVQNDKKTHL